MKDAKSGSASHRWKVLGVGVAANASFAAAFSGIPATAIWIRSDYRVDTGALGLLLGMLGLGIVLSELPWGVLTDRWGDRRVLLTGLGSTAAALLAMTLWCVPAATYVPGTHALAAMCILSAILTMCWVRDPEEPEPGDAARVRPREAPRARSPLSSAQVWRMVAGIAALCMPQVAVISFASVFLHDFGRAGSVAIGAALVAVQFGAACMRIWSGRWTDRHGNRNAYLRACALLSVALFTLLAAMTALFARVAHTSPVLGDGHIVLVALFVLLVSGGIAASAWHGVAFTELATLAGHGRVGTALAMGNTGAFMAFWLAPSAIPMLLSASGWPAVWLGASACAALAWPAFARVSRPSDTVSAAVVHSHKSKGKAKAGAAC